LLLEVTTYPDHNPSTQLFEERDAELDRNDRQIAELTATAQQRDATIAELRSELGEARGRLEGERSKLADLESFYSEQLRVLKEVDSNPPGCILKMKSRNAGAPSLNRNGLTLNRALGPVRPNGSHSDAK